MRKIGQRRNQKWLLEADQNIVLSIFLSDDMLGRRAYYSVFKKDPEDNFGTVPQTRLQVREEDYEEKTIYSLARN